MLGESLVGRVEARLVAARTDDRALEIIGNQQFGHRAHVLEGADVRGAPVGKRLSPGRLGVAEVARAERRDEDLGLAQLAGGTLNNRHRLPGVVHEQFLAGAVVLAHHQV